MGELVSFLIGEISHKWAQKAGLQSSYLSQTDSTNAWARKEALSRKDSIQFFWTDSQTSGKGRYTNTWSTKIAGDSLLMTLTYRLPQPPQPVLSPLMGLAVYRALHTSFPWLRLSLKAPNDIYLENSKLAGLLIESISQGSDHLLMVGLGLNVFAHPDLPATINLTQRVQELDPSSWAQFLDRLLLEFTLVVSMSPQEIPFQQREALLWALNQNPNLPNTYTDITAQGDLELGDRMIKWSEL